MEGRGVAIEVTSSIEASFIAIPFLPFGRLRVPEAGRGNRR
jgi:hypothetical protein